MATAGGEDFIDRLMDRWQAERPDLDVGPLAVVGRTIRIAEALKRELKALLRPYGLEVWEFDVLAALRWGGGEDGMTPTELMEALAVTSGTMTHRIDRLEQTGFVRRAPNPDDRRSVRIHLGDRGVEVLGKALAAHVESAGAAVSEISEGDQAVVADVLRRILAKVEGPSAG